MAELSADELSQFIGSENFYRHSLNKYYVYTDGVKYLAERGKCFWLLDKIALHGNRKLNREQFQVWKLKVHPHKAAELVVEDGNNHIIHTEHLTYTDFPLPEITIWAVQSEFGYTMMLPSEY